VGLGFNFSFKIISLVVSLFESTRHKVLPPDVGRRMLLVLGPWILLSTLLSFTIVAALAFWLSPWVPIGLFFCGTIVSLVARVFEMAFGKELQRPQCRPSIQNQPLEVE
jgi:CHASE2 domain-containing sensor protein